MKLLWSLINTLQVIEHLSYLSLHYPNILITTFAHLRISSFDLIPFNTAFVKLGINYTDRAYSPSFNISDTTSTAILYNATDIIFLTVILGLYSLVIFSLGYIRISSSKVQ